MFGRIMGSLKRFLGEYLETLVALAFLFLLACIFYFLSLSEPLSSLKAAERITQSIETIIDRNEDRRAALTHLLVSEVEASERRQFWKQTYLHLSIAFVVSIIIIVTVEFYAARRTKREILEYRKSVAKEVWQAILGRLIPPSITRELDGILKADVVKEDCRYVLTLKPPYKGMSEDLLVIQREILYTLKNITSEAIAYPITSFIANAHDDIPVEDVNGTKFMVPRHIAIRINDEVPEGGIDNVVGKDEKGRPRNLEHVVMLSDQGRVQVYLCNEEPMEVRGTNVYTTLTLVDALTVIVKNDYSQKVMVNPLRLHHPNWKDFKPGADGVYKYVGGLLPGQSFGVSWEPK